MVTDSSSKASNIVSLIVTNNSLPRENAYFGGITAILILATTRKALSRHIKGVHLLGKRCTISLLLIESSLHKLLVSGVMIGRFCSILLISHFKRGDLALT
jgi:hypothetical protein